MKMQKPRKSDTSVTDEERALLDKYAWMVRPCTVYIQEYSVCKSLKGRFDQYYTQGKFEDCKRWSDDRRDCREYTKEGDFKAGVRIIQNERNRIEERLKSFQENDVMKERKIRPPSNWNRQLPHYIEEKHENSYLSEHLDELSEPFGSHSSSSCVIL